jgi:hypothetical protein
MAYARSQVEIELNGVGDHPIFIFWCPVTRPGLGYGGGSPDAGTKILVRNNCRVIDFMLINW